MSEDTVTKGAQIPEQVAEALDSQLGYGDWSDYCNRLAEAIAFGGGYDERTPFDVVIQKKRDELEDAREKRDEWAETVDELERDIEDLKVEREEYKTTEDKFDGALWQIEQDFRAGELGHLDTGHTKIKNLAERFGRSPEAVVSELRDRNPDVPDYAFEQIAFADRKFTGLDEDRVPPVDERGQDADED